MNVTLDRKCTLFLAVGLALVLLLIIRMLAPASATHLKGASTAKMRAAPSANMAIHQDAVHYQLLSYHLDNNVTDTPSYAQNMCDLVSSVACAATGDALGAELNSPSLGNQFTAACTVASALACQEAFGNNSEPSTANQSNSPDYSSGPDASASDNSDGGMNSSGGDSGGGSSSSDGGMDSSSGDGGS